MFQLFNEATRKYLPLSYDTPEEAGKAVATARAMLKGTEKMHIPFLHEEWKPAKPEDQKIYLEVAMGLRGKK